jgi:hypothetical protein
MKPGMRAILSSALTLLLFFTTAFVLADETTAVYATKPIANFDDPAAGANWIVQGSKFATKDFPQMTIVRSWPEALFGRNKDNKSLLSMGIHGRFDRKGYNFIEIIPAKKGSDGKLAPAGIPLPGRVKILDMWVWGANYNFTVDIHVRDFQGIDHVLHMGSLMYPGWRNLSVTIPGSIPQARRYIPRYAGMELTKIVIWTAPDEKVDDFYVFLDEVNVLTDLFETRFDGEDLADPDTLNSIWAQGTR